MVAGSRWISLGTRSPALFATSRKTFSRATGSGFFGSIARLSVRTFSASRIPKNKKTAREASAMIRRTNTADITFEFYLPGEKQRNRNHTLVLFAAFATLLA